LKDANGNSSDEPQTTPSYPPGFTPSPQVNPNPPFPPYGLPPGYTPPLATTAPEVNNHASASNPTQGPPISHIPSTNIDPPLSGLPHQTNDPNFDTTGLQIPIHPSTGAPYNLEYTQPYNVIPEGILNHQKLNSPPTITMHHKQLEDSQSKDKLQSLEDR